MVLENYKDKQSKYLGPIAKRMTSTNPNHLTWGAFLCAVIGGLLILIVRGPQWWFILFFASVFIALNGILDLLDGELARITNRASKKGDFLDHVLDRYADMIMITCMVFTPFANFYIGFFAVLGVIFASYMGTQAQAIGVGRIYAGMLARSDRVAILTFTPIAQMFVLFFLGGFFTLTFQAFTVTFSIYDVVLLWFAVVGHATAIQRAVLTWRAIKD
jgi:archaetidylinositol phosphate synthase